jgi:hypothetical protein
MAQKANKNGQKSTEKVETEEVRGQLQRHGPTAEPLGSLGVPRMKGTRHQAYDRGPGAIRYERFKPSCTVYSLIRGPGEGEFLPWVRQSVNLRSSACDQQAPGTPFFPIGNSGELSWANLCARSRAAYQVYARAHSADQGPYRPRPDLRGRRGANWGHCGHS